MFTRYSALELALKEKKWSLKYIYGCDMVQILIKLGNILELCSCIMLMFHEIFSFFLWGNLHVKYSACQNPVLETYVTKLRWKQKQFLCTEAKNNSKHELKCLVKALLPLQQFPRNGYMKIKSFACFFNLYVKHLCVTWW